MHRTQRPALDVRLLNRKTRATDIILHSTTNPLTNAPFSQSYSEILKKRKMLPVFARLNELEDAFDKNHVIIVEGETGSGKTTQIPQVSHSPALSCRHCFFTTLHSIPPRRGSSAARSRVEWRHTPLRSAWRRRWTWSSARRWATPSDSRT